jgi:hypothetical protein
MAAPKTKTTKGRPTAAPAPTPSEVDVLLASKNHPLDAEIQQLRRLLLGVNAAIREEVKWNSVSFRNDNDFFATVNLRSTATLQLILYTGVKKKPTAETGVPVKDPSGLIEKWAAKDRCVLTLGARASFTANAPALTELVAAWIQFV